jgi:hypothetical protein
VRAWVVYGECGDYYCEGYHVIAVTSSEERAHDLAARATDPERSYKRFYETAVEEIEVDALLESLSHA